MVKSKMLFLKILGIILIAIISMILIILLCNIRVTVASKSKEDIKFKVHFGLFKLKDKKEHKASDKAPTEPTKKQQTKLPENIKKVLGIDKFDSIKKLRTNLKQNGFDGTFGKTIGIVKFLMKQLGILLKQVKIKKLNINYICAGNDAANTAVNYGLLCAFVYPFVTYIKETTNSKNGQISVNLNCDFDLNEPYFEFYFQVKLRVIYALIVFLKTISYIFKENKNENG